MRNEWSAWFHRSSPLFQFMSIRIGIFRVSKCMALGPGARFPLAHHDGFAPQRTPGRGHAVDAASTTGQKITDQGLFWMMRSQLHTVTHAQKIHPFGSLPIIAVAVGKTGFRFPLKYTRITVKHNARCLHGSTRSRRTCPVVGHDVMIVESQD